MGATSMSKVRGQIVKPDKSGWKLISDDEAMVVDKSVAIYDVMRDECGDVIAGLYPPRMGKTTFLDLLKDFLAVVSDAPYGERRSKHFGRYTVFKLDLKDLLTGGEDVDVGAHDRRVIMENVRRYTREITRTIKSFEILEGLKETKDDHLETIYPLLPELMEVFFRLFGRKSVLLVDDYDAPLVEAHCGIADVALRNRIVDIYTSFLSECLKDNNYLEKGVLVDVFDIKCAGMGSGLNNVQYYLAHTGIADTGEADHPFQRAFGFTGQDVGCLINHCIDATWKPCPEDNSSAKTRLKVHVFAGLLHHFNLYRIGNAPCIFCPYVVMEFFQKLGSVREPKDVHFEGFSSWAESGNLQMINTITEDSINNLKHYINNINVLFHRRFKVQLSIDALVEKHTVDTFDDDVINKMIHEQCMPSPFQVEHTAGAEIASICMFDPFSLSNDLVFSKHISSRTALKLLYQAGYLAPVARNEVAIPSIEVLQDQLHGF
ncbi:hypothetical protein LPJ61_001930 [Coemansia biformis]|uniref:AAA-ATPase-like domain-containing protein n=1 Tax=Coemansia biformis TaxID=1286918 RepID=A0A9W7Y970_9FUNG|nr:hypothetical protein LPJ61_001930 [Coemansia biformis]